MTTARPGLAIRRVTREELPAFFETVSIAFLEPMDAPAVAEAVAPYWDLDRVWVAWDGPVAAATFRSWASEVTLPGGATVPAAAVAGVTTRPTHRRRGLLRALAAAEHAAARERGEAVAMLHASEFPIYGRFGYGAAVVQATWTLDTTAPTFLAGDPRAVEIVSREAARSILPDVFERHRALQAGEIRRRDYRWDDELGLITFPWEKPWNGYVIVHRGGEDRPDGYARYTVEARWEQGRPSGTIAVQELIANGDSAYADLWRFLAEVDLVGTVRAERRRVHERLPWLLADQRAAAVVDVGDGVHLLLLDVARVLAARAYERTDRVVIEVVPPPGSPELGGGRFLLDASPDGATCRATTASPDLTVPLAALGAVVLGEGRLRWAAEAYGGVDEHAGGALERADRLFRTLDEPWCTTFF
ncbi:MAG TPA: GNAT family N-acetyltransferase [Candidatus Limnocylindrales bacterium]|nr:GNAT family N-acetyltransferase [Candidatus Limnocylindrales bacterium]